MRSVLSYTVTRLLLFIVVLGLLYLAGARGLLAAALAVLISGLVSFVVLSRQRDAMSDTIVGKVRGMRDRIDEGSKAEDDEEPAPASEEHDPAR